MFRRKLLAVLGGVAGSGCLRLTGNRSAADRTPTSTSERTDDATATRSPTPTTSRNTATATATSSGEKALLSESFTSSSWADEWEVISWEGGTAKRTDENDLRISSASYSYHGIKSTRDFSPPVTLTVDIERWTGRYGSAVYCGFINPDGYLSGTGRKASVYKRAADSVHMTFLGETPKFKFVSQRESPDASDGDTFTNQSGNKATRAELGWEAETTQTVELEWRSDRATLLLNGNTVFETTANVPSGAYPLYLHGQEWTGGDATELIVDRIALTG